MGQGIEIVCEFCGKYNEIFMEGKGLLFYPENFFNPPSIKPNLWDIVNDKNILNDIENLIKNKNARIVFGGISKDDFSDMLNEESKDNDDYNMAIYYSEKECKFYNLFNFTLEYYEGNKRCLYKPIYKDKYGKKLIRVELDDIIPDALCPGLTKCPHCGNSLSYDFLMID